MRKVVSLFFAVAMILSIVFIGDAVSSNGNLSVKAQTVVKKKKRNKGIVRRTYRGGRWVVRKSWNGTRWVYRRVWVATKWTGKKIWKNGRKVVSRTKKVVY